MSLLSVAQDVADVIGLTRPTAIVSSIDALSRQILGLARETLEELSGMGWPILEVPYQFNTVANQSSYALPADFCHMTVDTVFDASQYYEMRGSLTPADWARQRNALPSQLGRKKLRIFGNPLMVYITPVPTAVESVVFEYVTTNRVKASDGTYKATFYADDDVSLVAEDIFKRGLKWRLMREKGKDYSEEFNEYQMLRQQRLAQALALGSQPVAYRTALDDMGLYPGYVPEQGYGQ